MREFDKTCTALQSFGPNSLSLDDRFIVESFVRSEGRKETSGKAPLAVDSCAALFIRVDGVGFDAYVEPKALRGLVSKWRDVLDALPPADERVFTKDFIVQALADGVHDGRGAAMVACGAIWLVASTDDTVLDMLADTESALRFEISNNERANARRLAVELVDR